MQRRRERHATISADKANSEHSYSAKKVMTTPGALGSFFVPAVIKTPFVDQ